jgi:hypothetical protein
MAIRSSSSAQEKMAFNLPGPLCFLPRRSWRQFHVNSNERNSYSDRTLICNVALFAFISSIRVGVHGGGFGELSLVWLRSSVPQSLARGYEDRSYRSAEEALLMSAASEFLQRMIGMRKSITLSRRLIRLANDAELGILCGIVRLTKDILRKIVHAGAIIAFLTGAASAQMPMPGINLSPDRQMTPEEKEKQKAIENAYKSAIEKIPDKKPPADPWGAVRSSTPSSKPKQGQQ